MALDFHKRACLARARELLDDSGSYALRYVALELRSCIEAITYDKLGVYEKRLPKEVIETWQPPQAMRALLEIEPDADKDFVLVVSPESEPGVPTGEWRGIGTHRTFQPGWLGKAYNKLGSYLHVPTLRQGRRRSSYANLAKLRSDLKAIADELEPIAASSLDASIAEVVEFECTVCSRPSVCNVKKARDRQKALCLNPHCRAEYHVDCDAENSFSFTLIATRFECLACGDQTTCENRKLDIGFRFDCAKCGQAHELQTRQWGYCQVE